LKASTHSVLEWGKALINFVLDSRSLNLELETFNRVEFLARVEEEQV